jgi:hypothetical protein
LIIGVWAVGETFKKMNLIESHFRDQPIFIQSKIEPIVGSPEKVVKQLNNKNIVIIMIVDCFNLSTFV